MALREYKQKRNFRKTPEPGAKVAKSGKGSLFVVQKHDATRLHYDFRLELDGVLKSWAVPKGPSLDPAVKSLAVEVEDHPVAYANFEGVIPEGEYGGGTVIVWDHGTWEAEEDPHRGLKKGHLKFRVHGEKLNGGWHLVRLRAEGPKHNWLLFKQSDKYAKEGDQHGITERKPKSVLTNRSIDQVAKDADRVWTKTGEQKIRKKRASTKPTKAKGPAKPSKSRKGKRVKRAATTVRSQHRRTRPAGPLLEVDAIDGSRVAPMPRNLSPQLATLSSAVPTSGDWVHELKFDGYRILAEIDNGEVRLLTRKGNDWTKKFPEIAESLKHLPLKSAILDGELVANDERGVASFQRMQNALRDQRTGELVYYVFDVPYLEGYDLRKARLIDRKEALAKVLLSTSPGNDGMIRYSDHIRGHGEDVFRKSCSSSLEGIVCKRADSPYESARTRSWLKVKCHGRQEFVIGGFSKPERSRVGFGALLLGYYDHGQLQYAGRVGTGFDNQLLRDLSRRLKGMAVEESPFANPLTSAERRGVTYVRPELVAEIEFTEWTDDLHLRHPTFEGLREDKSAKDVIRELPANGAKSDREETSSMKKSSAAPKSRRDKSDDATTIAGVTLTHPDRVLFPDIGLTKLDLARYYEDVADWILPHVVDRPLTLVRCPDGSSGQCFYQKHWTETLPDAIDYASIKEKSGSDKYVVIKDLAGLISLVQISVLELHPWPSRVDRLENPDRVILDLDPGPGVDWKDVVQATHDVRDVLDELKLTSFVRTSGGKGLHVVVPLSRRNTWEEITDFAHNIATGLSVHASDRYVANMRKALRKGKIYIDYLRNQRGATAVANYSTRTRPGCPIATPITWKELGSLKSAADFTITNVPARLKRLKADPWEDFEETKQWLTKAMLSGAAKFATAKSAAK